MTAPKIAVYAEGCMYPGPDLPQPVSETIAQVRRSGFDTVILGLFHINGPDAATLQAAGDLSFNDRPIVASGGYIGEPRWPALIEQLHGGGITTICASFGGGGVADFANLRSIFTANGGSLAGTNLAANVAVFRETFPAVSIIDIDCEDTYDPGSLVAFCRLLADMGFGITFCPYTRQDFWVAALKELETTHPGTVRAANLQCYDGGQGNLPAGWARAIRSAMPHFDTRGFIIAGDWAEQSPAQVTALLRQLDTDRCLGGGFLWTLDRVIRSPGGMADYARAIAEGLQPVPA